MRLLLFDCEKLCIAIFGLMNKLNIGVISQVRFITGASKNPKKENYHPKSFTTYFCQVTVFSGLNSTTQEDSEQFNAQDGFYYTKTGGEDEQACLGNTAISGVSLGSFLEANLWNNMKQVSPWEELTGTGWRAGV